MKKGKILRTLSFVVGCSASIYAVKYLNKKRNDTLTGGSDGLLQVQAKRISFSSVSINHESDRELELKQVQIVVRHGARTPFGPIPNNPAVWDEKIWIRDLEHTTIPHHIRTVDGGSKPESAMEVAYRKRSVLNGGCLVGQLTTLGQEQMYQLGLRLRQRYIYQNHFLSRELNKDEIYVRSSNIDRTIKSIRCVVAGMYGKENIHEPITILTCPNEQEFIYPNFHACKNLKYWVGVAWSKTDDVEGFTQFALSLKEQLGMDDKEKVNALDLRDNIVARLTHNIPVPKFLLDKRQEIDEMAVKVQLWFVSGTQNSKNILRMQIGRFVETLCTRIDDTIDGRCDHKMLLYSSHDTSLMALLQVMGVFDNKWPDYAADLRTELYKHDKDWFVKVVYNGKDLIMPGCDSELCPLDRFKEVVGPYRVTDWEFECGNTANHKEESYSIGTV